MSLEAILEMTERFENAIEDRHLIEGLILPTLVLPPIGREDLQTGNYENCAVWTGLYVAAQALKYAKTGDLKARAKAKRGLLALNRLQNVSGKPGFVSRGYKLRVGSDWDEDLFWKKNLTDPSRRKDEWHQSGDYRFLGDTSRSQILGVTYGYFAFNNLCNPDSEEKALISKYVVQIVQSIIDNGGKIVDLDGKPTGWGDYNGYGIGPALLLSSLKLAYVLTGEERFHEAYTKQFNLAVNKGIRSAHRLAIWPVNRWHTTFGSDYHSMMLNYNMLLKLEKNPEILGVYTEGLNNLWRTINDPENALFNFIYSASGGQDFNLQQGIDALERFPANKIVDGVALKRQISAWMRPRDIMRRTKMPLEERSVDEYAWRINPFRHDNWIAVLPGKMEFTGIDYLFAANFGRYYDFIK